MGSFAESFQIPAGTSIALLDDQTRFRHRATGLTGKVADHAKLEYSRDEARGKMNRVGAELTEASEESRGRQRLSITTGLMIRIRDTSFSSELPTQE